MRILLLSRSIGRLASTKQYLAAKHEKNHKEVIDKLVSRAQEYRQELRKHVKSSLKYRSLNQSINSIDQTLEILQMKRKQLDEIFDTSQKPDLVSLEVLSNGTTHIRPSVFIRTPFSTYLFNCPEGTSRFLSSLRVRPQTIQNFFITKGDWDCFGGLFGVLLAKETLDHVTHLHGPSNLKYFLECVRPFADSDFSNNKPHQFQVEERTYKNEKYEDNAVTVNYIPLFGMKSEQDMNSLSKSFDVAYLLELTPPNKRVDITKLLKKNVPKGPMIGRLKAGESVMLEDGTIVTPEEVYADDSKDHSPNILIVECDNVEKLESLITNSHLQKYTTGQATMGYVVHFSPEAVTNDQKYKDWMESFGSQCLHLLANGSGEALPLSDGIYRQQRMLNEICPDLFPEIFLHDFCSTVTQTVDTPETNIVCVKPLEKYPMRITKASSFNNDAITISLAEAELAVRIAEDKDIVPAIEQFKQEAQKIDTSGDNFPSVAFLGTGSAVPTKYRNVSGYLLQLNADTSVLIDCGEGTFGQMKALFGPEKIANELVKLSAIFVTHAHLDHIGGIKTIIKRRLEAFSEKGLEYKPLILACNYNVKKMLIMYRTNFQNLEQHLKYAEIGLYIRNLDEYLKYSGMDLISDVTKMFPSEIYSAERWNLKKVTAVQVHHTRMANGFVFDTNDGKRIVFSGDTMPCQLLAETGKNADLLIHEATFEDGYEVDATKKKHSTTGQAIDISEQMNARFMILSHFSARYPRVPVITDRMIETKNVGIAFDNMVVPYNKYHLLPLLLPMFRKLFEKDLLIRQKFS